MVSQLVCIPVVLRKDCIDRESLEELGTVTETEEGWVVDYTARVGYFLDDETFMYYFYYAAGNLGLTTSDVVRFDWDKVEKIKRVLP